jgi:hypothetical protein
MFPPKQHPQQAPRPYKPARHVGLHQEPVPKTVALVAVDLVVGAPVIRRPWLGRLARAIYRTFGAFVRSQPKWRPWK